mmetsp:Transcript_26232/g.80752  ORF Transcript_26232/g.80752 Transcript_26232/m.80752 type:complete len:191 (+) Transcript_26232:512-1084(+)
MASQNAKSLARQGEQIWAKMPKVNGEFFALTYGSLVVQLVEDFDDIGEVNKKLEEMGYSIGTRIIDEFLAKSGVGGCADFAETCEVIAKVAFKMFLGVDVDIANWNDDKTACSLILPENPLNENVELPPGKELLYSNILCGVIRGALEMILLKVDCYYVKDVLRGDETNEIRVCLLEKMQVEMADEYKES